MKRILNALTVSLCLWLPAAVMAAQPAATVAAAAHGTYYQLQVDGLACPFCAYGIEKKLHAIDGVEDIQTDIKSGSVFIQMAVGAALDEATAKRAVEAAGFRLKSLKETSGMPTNPED